MTMEISFAIRDFRRHGEKIIVSPGLHIAAICDSFGRIIVYDIHRGIAVRMFKGKDSFATLSLPFDCSLGYREAEIGFIQIEEAANREISKKSALFLIIHAPKRQLVEVK
jgi:Rab3 GTPase-activating protein non-catalytic subunit